MVTEDFVSIDSSNHEHVKLLQIIVRYCREKDGSMSAATKLLDFVELKGEKAEELAAEIMVVVLTGN